MRVSLYILKWFQLTYKTKVLINEMLKMKKKCVFFLCIKKVYYI